MASDTPPIRVLHLEDNAGDAELIAHQLVFDGVACDISMANSEESFDTALHQTCFDLILCDYNLPGYDGMRALKRAKTLRPDTPVIIISGTVGDEEAVRCLHNGATDYLLKQHLERLGPAVKRAIKEAEERRSRARAEEALQQRERRLTSIYEAIADVLLYVDVEPDGGYRFNSVNPPFESATGLRSEQVVGQRLDDVIPPAWLPLVLERCRQAIDEKKVVRWEVAADYPIGRRTGEVAIAPVFDAAGHCTHLVGSVRDITERRQLEAQLRQAQKMESVGKLAGGIAHDFNNLLTVINGSTELALMQVDGRDPQLHEDLQEIRRAGERAGALTRQLLAFSRKQILQPQIIDLNTTVNEMGTLLRRLLGEDIDLVIAPAAAPATVKADPGQFEQVIANLAVNARDAMPTGGRLSIETHHVILDEAFGRTRDVVVKPGPYVVLTMTDTGTGMDEATRRQIFEPFFTTKGFGKGTGLGLSTVYGIVKQSDGFVWVESEPGRGACFTVYLPRVDEMATARPAKQAVAPARGSETILVVEDVGGLRRLIARTLESAGYTILGAGSGEEAIEVLERFDRPVHLLITDVVMPGMSGRDLAQRLDRSRPDMRVLYMSGYTDDVVMQHRVLAKGVRFLTKPFSTAELVRVVRQVLDAPPHEES